MNVSYSVIANARTNQILTGEIRPKGVELSIHVAKSINENTMRMLNGDFDIAEMSVATFLKAVDRGNDLALLPVFTSGRRFVQGGAYVSTSSSISSMNDLEGRVVGLPQYWMSSSLWHRIALLRMHNIDPSKLTWVTLQRERISGSIPENVEVKVDTSGRTMAELLSSGEIEACLMAGGGRAGSELSDIARPAYSDAERAKREFYTASGAVPLMHVTAVNRVLVERAPEIVPNMLDAYQACKRDASHVRASRQSGPLASFDDSSNEEAEIWQITGMDPFQYGVTPNRGALELAIEAAHTGGLLGRAFKVEELLVPNIPRDLQ